jgi:hypothetical protein
MKKLITFAILTVLTTGLLAQAPSPFPKTINVTGTAELEIIPDEIYVVVTLKEYEKKGIGKIDLDKIKTDFLNNCKSIGLPDSAVTIATYEGNNPKTWREKRVKNELYATIAYQIRFNSSKKIDELVSKLDDNATQNFDVSMMSHSKIQEYRKQVKIQAIKAAKAKAEYLTMAIGEQLGVAVTITERQFNDQNEERYNINQLAFGNNGVTNGDWNEGVGVDFKKLKIRMEMNVVFSLK